MIKKILLVTLGIIVAGALGVGAYDYVRGDSTLELPDTSTVFANEAVQNSVGLGQGNGQGRGQGQGGQGQGQGQGRGQGQGGQGQGRGHGPGGGQGQGQGAGTGEPIQHDWLTLNGAVIGLEQPGLRVDTDERGELLLNLGRPGFAEEQNVTFNAGDTVTIQGFDSPEGAFVAGTITNETSGEALLLRDPNGRPLWAGPGRQGQGGGQGQGRGQGGGQGQGRGQGGGQGQGRGQGGGWGQGGGQSQGSQSQNW